jgi:predicted transcriptional regulator
MVSLREAEDIMVSELKIVREEAKIYMLLLNKGKMSRNRIIDETSIDMHAVEKALTSLIDKGSCIEMNGEYEALNPRFAITNMYRMMCYANNQEVKRNKTVDQLATILEKPYEDARTK